MRQEEIHKFQPSWRPESIQIDWSMFKLTNAGHNPRQVWIINVIIINFLGINSIMNMASEYLQNARYWYFMYIFYHMDTFNNFQLKLLNLMAKLVALSIIVVLPYKQKVEIWSWYYIWSFC